MTSREEKVVSAFYGLFGSFLALLVYSVVFDGWEYVFTGDSKSLWIGPFGLIVCLVIGCALGLLSYWHQHKEFDLGLSVFWTDMPTALLFSKHLVVIAGSIAALFFIWQLARSAS